MINLSEVLASTPFSEAKEMTSSKEMKKMTLCMAMQERTRYTEGLEQTLLALATDGIPSSEVMAVTLSILEMVVMSYGSEIARKAHQLVIRKSSSVALVTTPRISL